MATNGMTIEVRRPARARRPAASTGEETLRFLAGTPLFETLSREDLRRVVEIAVPRTFAAGQVVFREGDRGDTCYVVWSGRARAVRAHRDGRTITLASFGPGDVFGELAVFERERRSATIEATSSIRVLAILGGDMRRLLHAHPGMAIGLGIALGRKLRTTNDRLSRQAFQSVQSRVAGVLGALVDHAGHPDADAGDGGARVLGSQADIAQLAGCSRESVSRFLAQLERAGVIAQGRAQLVVLRRDRLDAYVF